MRTIWKKLLEFQAANTWKTTSKSLGNRKKKRKIVENDRNTVDFGNSTMTIFAISRENHSKIWNFTRKSHFLLHYFSFSTIYTVFIWNNSNLELSNVPKSLPEGSSELSKNCTDLKISGQNLTEFYSVNFWTILWFLGSLTGHNYLKVATICQNTLGIFQI